MKKIGLNHLVIAVFVISAAFISCGGGDNSKSLNGTYVGSVFRAKTTIVFSGNKIKIVSERDMLEGFFELVEEYKDDDFSRGKLIITSREGKKEATYELEKKGKMLTFDRNFFIKEGTKSSEEYLSGVYVGNNNQSISFSGNKFEWGRTGTYEFFFTEDNKEGFSSGIVGLTFEEDMDYWLMKYVLEGDKLNFGGNTYIKK